MNKEKLLEKLPIVIARSRIREYLGNIIAPGTLANADSKGTGPGGRFYIGKKCVYDTRSLLDWLEHKGKI